MAFQADFGRTAKDYACYRAGFPDSFFARLEALGVAAPGRKLLDLGTGAGTLARGFASRGLDVTGLDRSPEMMAEAARLDREAGVEVRYLTATAEATGLPDDAFDVVSAGQCWHWFESARVAAEVRRVLVPGGRLIIAYFDWIPLPGSVVEATERLIEAHNPDWPYGGGSGIHPHWLADVAEAGYGEIESFSYDLDVAYGHEAWRGRIRASAGVGASLPTDKVAAFDAALARLLAERFPQAELAAPHRVFAILCRAP